MDSPATTWMLVTTEPSFTSIKQNPRASRRVLTQPFTSTRTPGVPLRKRSLMIERCMRRLTVMSSRPHRTGRASLTMPATAHLSIKYHRRPQSNKIIDSTIADVLHKHAV